MNAPRLLLLAVILLGMGAIRPPKPGQLVFVYQTTDAQLIEQIQRAGRWKDFFILSARFGNDPDNAAADMAWAAYYAGREAVLTEQLYELYTEFGIPLVKPRKE